MTQVIFKCKSHWMSRQVYVATLQEMRPPFLFLAQAQTLINTADYLQQHKYIMPADFT